MNVDVVTEVVAAAVSVTVVTLVDSTGAGVTVTVPFLSLVRDDKSLDNNISAVRLTRSG